MKTFYFKIGKRELCLESTDVKTSYTLAEAWKEHYKWKGKVILIAIQE